MNEQNVLTKIIMTLEQGAFVPFASDCSEKLKNNTILFNSGFKSERLHLYHVYKTRLYIAKNLNREKFVDEELVHWEKALRAIEKTKDEDLVLSWFQSDSYVYLMFFTVDFVNLVSIIRLTSLKPFSDTEAHYDKTMNSKYPTKISMVKFEKGELVKKWN